MLELLPDEIPPVTTPEEQRIVNAYRTLFNGPDWQIVRADLIRKFGANKPAFIPNEQGALCPLRAAMKTGAYAVLVHIGTRLLQPAQLAANMNAEKLKVVK